MEKESKSQNKLNMKGISRTTVGKGEVLKYFTELWRKGMLGKRTIINSRRKCGRMVKPYRNRYKKKCNKGEKKKRRSKRPWRIIHIHLNSTWKNLFFSISISLLRGNTGKSFFKSTVESFMKIKCMVGESTHGGTEKFMMALGNKDPWMAMANFFGLIIRSIKEITLTTWSMGKGSWYGM